MSTKPHALHPSHAVLYHSSKCTSQLCLDSFSPHACTPCMHIANCPLLAPPTAPTGPAHLLCSFVLHELNEGKAHRTVGVTTDAAVHDCTTVSKECCQALLSHL